MSIVESSPQRRFRARLRLRTVAALAFAVAGTALLFLVPSLTLWFWLLLLADQLASPPRTKPPHEITPRDIWLFLAVLAVVLLLLSLYWHYHGIPYSPPPDQVPPLSLSFRLSLWCVWLIVFAVRLHRSRRHQVPTST